MPRQLLTQTETIFLSDQQVLNLIHYQKHSIRKKIDAKVIQRRSYKHINNNQIKIKNLDTYCHTIDEQLKILKKQLNIWQRQEDSWFSEHNRDVKRDLLPILNKLIASRIIKQIVSIKEHQSSELNNRTHTSGFEVTLIFQSQQNKNTFDYMSNRNDRPTTLAQADDVINRLNPTTFIDYRHNHPHVPNIMSHKVEVEEVENLVPSKAFTQFQNNGPVNLNSKFAKASKGSFGEEYGNNRLFHKEVKEDQSIEISNPVKSQAQQPTLVQNKFANASEQGFGNNFNLFDSKNVSNNNLPEEASTITPRNLTLTQAFSRSGK